MRSITGFDYAHDDKEAHINDDENAEENQEKENEVSNFSTDVKFGQERWRQGRGSDNSVITPNGSYILSDPPRPYSNQINQ